jgi:hypothetical protein
VAGPTLKPPIPFQRYNFEARSSFGLQLKLSLVGTSACQKLCISASRACSFQGIVQQIWASESDAYHIAGAPYYADRLSTPRRAVVSERAANSNIRRFVLIDRAMTCSRLFLAGSITQSIGEIKALG